jgi:phosphoglycerate kinase
MSFFKKTIRDVPLSGHTVLVRVDYNVPLAQDGSISDDLRIRASIPTLQFLLARGCKIVLISHLGRPEGRDMSLSLEPAAVRLGELLEKPVVFVDDITGDEAYQAVRKAPKEGIVMLQNLRFDPGEEADDMDFAKGIAHASQADFFVQDGFGVVHRAHASTHAITLQLPSVAGLLLEREYTTITDVMEDPKRPLVAVLGGAKVSDKIGLVERFVQLADKILIGGAMANNFLAYKGIAVGKSKVEADQAEVLDAIYTAAREKVGDAVDDFIVLPSDVAVATEVDPHAARSERKVTEIGPDEQALDIGPESIDRYCRAIEGAGSVIWNGTMGVAELPNFAHGSARIALTLATHPEITSIVGGGDTADFVLKWDAKKGGSFTHVSTGGGAGLDLMAGKKLPGVESLLDAS